MSLVRDRQPELMDRPDLEPALHRRALRALGRLNYFSRTSSAIWNVLRQFQPASVGQPLRVLDVACGGGDVAIRLAQRARLENRNVQFTGIDTSETAIQYGRDRAALREVDVKFETSNVFEQALPEDQDVVISTLFLHHLNPTDGVGLLRRMGESAKQGIIIDDLRPTRLGYFLAWTACQLLSRSHIVHNDGPMSVRAAYTPAEAIELANRAGMYGGRTITHWPQRYLLSWRRS